MPDRPRGAQASDQDSEQRLHFGHHPLAHGHSECGKACPAFGAAFDVPAIRTQYSRRVIGHRYGHVMEAHLLFVLGSHRTGRSLIPPPGVCLARRVLSSRYAQHHRGKPAPGPDLIVLAAGGAVKTTIGCRTPVARFKGRACLSAQGELPGAVDMSIRDLGRRIPRCLVRQRPALTHRADEEDRPHVPVSPAAHLELVQGQRARSSSVMAELNIKTKLTLRKS